jgi:tRNA nucleotidyltransferase (CCA-adding enzyme)
MNSSIKKILNTIESNGFEAYIIGGYVRDHLLGIESTDVDICTNALPKDIMKIFGVKSDISSYGSIKLTSSKYNFDITTYRRESHFNNRRPEEVEYINNLLEDIKRRDFTINSLCMNSNEEIIDLLNGKEDINNKLIKVIGDINTKFTDDPLRMLRAVRFAVILDFNLDEDIVSFIKSNRDLIKSLSYTRKKEELEKILSSKNSCKGLKLLKELHLLDTLEINYDKIVYVPDILGMWSQITFSSNYPFTKSALSSINNIRMITSLKIINNEILFKYDLYVCLVAGSILGISKEDITKKYNDLPIHSAKELMVNSNDIMSILNISPSFEIKEIHNMIIKEVINNSLKNNYEEIKEYLIKNWK